jgi:hypothetical protein
MTTTNTTTALEALELDNYARPLAVFPLTAAAAYESK